MVIARLFLGCEMRTKEFASKLAHEGARPFCGLIDLMKTKKEAAPFLGSEGQNILAILDSKIGIRTPS